MAKECPSCKAEVKEGHKFCLGCGAQLQTDAPAQPQQPTQPPAMRQQTYTQPQPVAPMQPKKTNMKLIGGIIAIIVIVVVVALVAFMFIGGGSDSRFVGTWAYEEPTLGMSIVYKFNGDGSLEAGSDLGTIRIGTWSVSGNQLCMNIDVASYGSGEQCGSYSFSTDGSELTLTF